MQLETDGVIDMKLATDGDTSDKFFSSFDAAIESARVDAKLRRKMRNALSPARLRKIRRVEWIKLVTSHARVSQRSSDKRKCSRLRVLDVIF